MPTLTVRANDQDWPLSYPGRPGALHRLLADSALIGKPLPITKDMGDEAVAALNLEWIDYQDAVYGVELAAIWAGDPLPSMARRAPPVGEAPAGDLWPLAKGDNALTFGLAFVDDLYQLGWRPSEVKGAIEASRAHFAAWLGPQPKRAEVDEAVGFSEAPTAAPT